MIEILPELCSKCGFCVECCPSMIFSMDQNIIRVEFEDYCILCGHCIAICPEDAIRHGKLDYTQFRDIQKTQIDSQDLYTLFETRRSVRNFKKRAISRELIDHLLSETRYAPTASNLQNVKYLVLQNQAKDLFVAHVRSFYANILEIFQSSQTEDNTMLRRIRKWKHWLFEAEKGRDALFYNPPAIIIAYAPSSNSLTSLNVGFAIAYLMLAAHAIGLGTINIGYAVEAIRRNPKIVEDLGISTEEYWVYAVVSIGYPAFDYLKIPVRNPAHITWQR
ncbi:MAG: nitroreductase family protein [Promethearchaeota archaeon]